MKRTTGIASALPQILKAKALPGLIVLLAAVAACGHGKSPSSSPTSGGTSALIAGPIEDAYYHPWAVRLPSCGATLIAPQWALTAAHCVSGATTVRYERRNPHTGEVHGDSVASERVARHPDYVPSSSTEDIALIKLSRPLEPAWHTQFAALPENARVQGTPGVMATSQDHDTGTVLDTKVKVLRAPIGSSSGNAAFTTNKDATIGGAETDSGDSGSGFVTVEAGRAVIRGVTRARPPLITHSGSFTDVFFYRDWILRTMGADTATLSGNTHIRGRGLAAVGYIEIECGDNADSYRVPLDIHGAELRHDCAGGAQRTVTCEIVGELPATTFAQNSKRRVRRLLVHTFEGTTATTQTVAATNSRLASFTDSPPAGTRRRYECQIEDPDFPDAGNELRRP